MLQDPISMAHQSRYHNLSVHILMIAGCVLTIARTIFILVQRVENIKYLMLGAMSFTLLAVLYSAAYSCAVVYVSGLLLRDATTAMYNGVKRKWWKSIELELDQAKSDCVVGEKEVSDEVKQFVEERQEVEKSTVDAEICES